MPRCQYAQAPPTGYEPNTVSLASGSAGAQASGSRKKLDAGHEVQIFLTAEATYLMRKATTEAIFPVGWPALSELRQKILAKHIPVFS